MQIVSLSREYAESIGHYLAILHGDEYLLKAYASREANEPKDTVHFTSVFVENHVDITTAQKDREAYLAKSHPDCAHYIHCKIADYDEVVVNMTRLLGWVSLG